MKCEQVPHTVRLTDREVNIIAELRRQQGKRSASDIIRSAIVLYGGSYGIRTNADGKVI